MTSESRYRYTERRPRKEGRLSIGGHPMFAMNSAGYFFVAALLIGGAVLAVMHFWPPETARGRLALEGVGAFATGVALLIGLNGGYSRPRPAADAPTRELRDYPWDRHGFAINPWPTVWRGSVTLVVLAVTLGLFGRLIIAETKHSDVAWWLCMAAYGCVVVGGPIHVGLQGLRARRYGETRVRFVKFPLPVEGLIDVFWEPPAGDHEFTDGSFTLRCMEQRLVESDKGSDRSSETRDFQLWGGTWELETPLIITGTAPDRAIALGWQPPCDLPGTCISAPTPCFWELEVHLRAKGPDFRAIYLIPVYTTAFE